MTNPQGTAWETETVNRAKDRGIPARRLVKQSQKDEADVLMGGDDDSWHIPALFWKRIVKAKKGKPRQPLGERYVVVLGVDDFLDLLERYQHDRDGLPHIWVQNKWAEQISVTKVLYGLRKWLATRMESI